MRRCPQCGSQVPDNSLTCPQCFTPIARDSEVVRDGMGNERMSPGTKSGNIAMLLALLPGLVGIWGLGHIYLGEMDRGLRFLVLGVLMTLSMVLLASASYLVFTVICLVFLALAWLALFAYHAFEVLALTAMKGATPPRWPFGRLSR
ncbi:MAG: zinc ribbon domain-containing protein [Candidatus Methanomethylophilaceae archaeon]|nr:zinc ribbon domain-containing protein [Candidatus Methanomethylophilaceae archaeon]